MSMERIETAFEEEAEDRTLQLGQAALTADLVKQYFTEIGRTPLLTAEQEVEVSKRIEAGLFAGELLSREDFSHATVEELEWLRDDGRQARGEMLEANTRLVVSLARKRQGRGMPLIDLIQEGNLGLIRAVEKFDYQKGYKFSTYATWWVRQAITRGIAEKGRTIRLPVHVVEDVNKIATVTRSLSLSLGRDPLPEEIADECDFTIEKVLQLMDVSRDTLSLDTPIGDDGDATLEHMLEDEATVGIDEVVINDSVNEELRSIIELLSEREADIVMSRYGFSGGKPESLKDVGDRWGISPERTRQIERETLRKLRGLVGSSGNFDYDKIAAQRKVMQQDSVKKQAPVGQRQQQRLGVAHELQLHKTQLQDQYVEVLEAFVSNRSKAEAARELGVSQATFSKRLTLARNVLKTLKNQQSNDLA